MEGFGTNLERTESFKNCNRSDTLYIYIYMYVYVHVFLSFPAMQNLAGSLLASLASTGTSHNPETAVFTISFLIMVSYIQLCIRKSRNKHTYIQWYMYVFTHIYIYRYM